MTMAPQCIPTSLCRAEDGTYCQQHNYLTADPISVIKTHGYFTRVRDRLRVGDTILITRVLADRVCDRFELLVVKLPEREIEFRLLGEILSIPALAVEEPEPEPAEPQFVQGDCVTRWNPGRQLHQVIAAADGAVICGVRDKSFAEQIAQGSVPIPEHRQEAA